MGAILAAAIAFGGPTPLAPLPSVNDPFKSVDFSGLPPIETFAARDGTQLGYRRYGQPNNSALGSVVLVHGSAARSNSMHPLARHLAARGYVVYALDMRGHGDSGQRGQIGYIGQLEDDLQDFVKARQPMGRKTLVGFSAGGGFALRFAADSRRKLFDDYLLLAPFLGQSASTYRPGSGGWASVGMARIAGLLVLNQFGITGLNHLPVVAYAVTPEAKKFLTPSYSYALSQNFRPHHDYQSEIARASQPMEVLVGANDEQFYAERYAAEFRSASHPVNVSIIPNTGHIDLTLSPTAIEATTQALERLRHGS